MSLVLVSSKKEDTSLPETGGLSVPSALGSLSPRASPDTRAFPKPDSRGCWPRCSCAPGTQTWLVYERLKVGLGFRGCCWPGPSKDCSSVPRRCHSEPEDGNLWLWGRTVQIIYLIPAFENCLVPVYKSEGSLGPSLVHLLQVGLSLNTRDQGCTVSPPSGPPSNVPPQLTKPGRGWASPEKSHHGGSLEAVPSTEEGAPQSSEQRPAPWVLVFMPWCFKPERWWAHYPARPSRPHLLPGSCCLPRGSTQARPGPSQGHTPFPAVPRSARSCTHRAHGLMPQAEPRSVLVLFSLLQKVGVWEHTCFFLRCEQARFNKPLLRSLTLGECPVGSGLVRG